jgi:hypothetical protein
MNDHERRTPLRARPWQERQEALLVFVTTRSDERRAELLPSVPGLCHELRELTYWLKTPPGDPPKDADLGPDVEQLLRAAEDSRTIDEVSRRRITEVCRKILTYGQSNQLDDMA